MIIKKVKLFPNNNEKSIEIAEKLEDFLIKNKIEVTRNLDYNLAIAIGGDGSFLRMLKSTNFSSDIYYIGINTGTLGFLQEIRPDKLEEFVYNLKNEKYRIEKIGIQETKIKTSDELSIFYSLNDIVIRDKELNTTIIDICIDDVKLEKFAGDGVLISTSVGSTAYNLSYGGSIIYNTLHTLQITPIAPLNSKAYKSLTNGVVIPEDKLITLIPDKNKNNIIVTIDGENNFYDNVDKIETIVSKKKISCIRMNDYNFINIINDKFLN